MTETPMPQVYDENGELIPLSLFDDVTVLPDGSVRMTWVGGRPLRPTRIANGYGNDMPLIPGACLADRGVLTVSQKPPSKVKATGILMRGGKAVYDDLDERAAAKAAGQDVWEPG